MAIDRRRLNIEVDGVKAIVADAVTALDNAYAYEGVRRAREHLRSACERLENLEQDFEESE